MNNYSFLQDELAVTEIRKHQWIESEKKGQAIGFATAAIDWIKKYGMEWQRFRLATNPQNVLAEKRRHRRFNQQFPIKLQVNNTQISAHTDTISLVGLTCTVSTYIPDNTPTKVIIGFYREKQNQPPLQFHSRIARISKSDESERTGHYNIFVPFTEDIRDYIRINADAFVQN